MYSLLFRNRLAALAFVMLTVISAASLVGTEEHDGVISQTAQQIEGQKAEFETAVKGVNSPGPVPSQFHQQSEPIVHSGPVEFTSDEDLIDAAEGFDPTPEDGFQPEKTENHEEVTIILENQNSAGPEE